MSHPATLFLGRPIRYLQVNTFYPAYLRAFYAARPDLKAAAYQAQIDALLDDGFSGPHMMTRELAKAGWETMQVIANDKPAQRQWLKENELTLPEPLNGDLVAAMQIQMFRPDIVYFTESCQFDTKFIRKLPSRPALVTGWRGFPITPGTDWTGYDLIFTSFDQIMAEAPKFGARDVRRHHPGYPTDSGIGAEPASYDCDVVFAGSVTGHHRQRIEALMAVWLAAKGADGGTPFTFHLHMPDGAALAPEMQQANRGSVWGDTMLEVQNRARIVINIDIDAFGAQPPNMRLIEATGSGAFLLTSDHPQLGDFFTPGEEVETFRGPGELVSKIRHYLAHDPERRAIARAGRAKCLAKHALDQTAAHFRGILTDKLAGLSQ